MMRRILILSPVLLLVLGRFAAGEPVTEEPPRKAKTRDLPAWVFDARWYQLDLARFRNGERSNDPPGTQPWWVSPDTDRHLAQQPGPFGGDLQGVQEKLKYLKHLGVNALVLSPVFAADLRHVIDEFGLPPGDQGGKTGQKEGQNARSASDQLFLNLLQTAHRDGFRVIVHAPTIRGEDEFYEAIRRWMAPTGAGKLSDGIDGWVVSVDDHTKPERIQRFVDVSHKTNAQAILVGNVVGKPPAWLGKAGMPSFDLAISFEVGTAVRRFLRENKSAYDVQRFFKDLDEHLRKRPIAAQAGWLNAVSDRSRGRLLFDLAAPKPGDDDRAHAAKPPSNALHDRWRLAVALQHFLPGSPVTYFGDEVGKYNMPGAPDVSPMWWKDSRRAPDDPGYYREDFHAWIRYLHRLRGDYASLRRGAFKSLVLDDDRKVLALARVLPDETIIIAINYGPKRQRVSLSVGHPGRMTGMLSPQWPTTPTDDRVRVSASRQIANKTGHVTVTVQPMSVRIVLVRDDI